MAWDLAPLAMELDDVRLWSKHLGPTDSQALWRQTWDHSDGTDYLELYLKFDELRAVAPIDNFGACDGEMGVDFVGHTVFEVDAVADAQECCDVCSNFHGCLLWTYDTLSRLCWLKDIAALPNLIESEFRASGRRATMGRTVSDRPCTDHRDCFSCMSAVDSTLDFNGEPCVPVVSDDDTVCMSSASVVAVARSSLRATQ